MFAVLHFEPSKLMKTRLLLLIFLLATEVAAAAEIQGRVRFVTRRGQKPAVSETVISLEAPATLKASRPGTFVVTTRSKALIPHVVAVPAGSTVRFPNEDPVTHNLFSVSPANPFDLGLYRSGTGKEKKFDRAGIVHVYCNVHPNMSAVIHVMGTPHFTFAAADGSFVLKDVAPGSYRLRAWNEFGETSMEITVASSARGPVELVIDSTKRRSTQHMNKYGQPYGRNREY